MNMFILLSNYIDITFAEACLVAVVCVVIVFAMLALLWGVVSLLKVFAPKAKVEVKENKPAVVASAPQKAFTAADIKDEDMMVAALIASIDYQEETKENVRVVSVKQIG